MNTKLYEKAARLMEQGAYPQAIELFSQLLAEAPGHVSCLHGRAYARFRMQDFEGAIYDYSAALILEPSRADLYSERGVAFHLWGRRTEALTDFDKAAGLEPSNPYRFSSRAFVRAHYGDLHGAIADYEKAISLDPDDAVAHNNLGMLQEKMGYKDRAKDHFTKADGLAAQHPKTDGEQEAQPSLDDLLKAHREEKARKEEQNQQAKAAWQKEQQKLQNEQPVQSASLTLSAFGKTLRQLLTDPQMRRELVAFVKNGFRLPSQ